MDDVRFQVSIAVLYVAQAHMLEVVTREIMLGGRDSVRGVWVRGSAFMSRRLQPQQLLGNRAGALSTACLAPSFASPLLRWPFCLLPSHHAGTRPSPDFGPIILSFPTPTIMG